jgi:hypothetical protein
MTRFSVNTNVSSVRVTRSLLTENFVVTVHSSCCLDETKHQVGTEELVCREFHRITAARTRRTCRRAGVTKRAYQVLQANDIGWINQTIRALIQL